MLKRIRSIAIIDPLGDFGIGGYVYELAEGLCANGVKVDVYTSGIAHMKDLALPRNHGLYPVLGSPLVRQRDRLRETRHFLKNASVLTTPDSPEVHRERRGLVPKLASFLMPYELALYLKLRRYDVIWTQWPVMTRYGIQFWAICKALGMRLVHTVHNVLPHEDANNSRDIVRKVYEYSDALIVHSEYSRRELLHQFPNLQGKELKMQFGLYTMFPRCQGDRDSLREQLNIPRGSRLLLFYGGIRPYKNIDALLEALREKQDVILVVAGRESGYPDLVPGDPLGRTRRIAASLGVLDRTRLIPGMLDIRLTAELFEGADALLLPYLQSYGSGVLLLGMTLGLHIIATRTGGMEEYLEEYPARTLLTGPDSASVAQGIDQALKSVANRDKTQMVELSHLDWRNVTKAALRRLEGALFSSLRTSES